MLNNPNDNAHADGAQDFERRNDLRVNFSLHTNVYTKAVDLIHCRFEDLCRSGALLVGDFEDLVCEEKVMISLPVIQGRDETAPAVRARILRDTGDGVAVEFDFGDNLMPDYITELMVEYGKLK